MKRMSESQLFQAASEAVLDRNNDGISNQIAACKCLWFIQMKNQKEAPL